MGRVVRGQPAAHAAVVQLDRRAVLPRPGDVPVRLRPGGGGRAVRRRRPSDRALQGEDLQPGEAPEERAVPERDPRADDGQVDDNRHGERVRRAAQVPGRRTMLVHSQYNIFKK